MNNLIIRIPPSKVTKAANSKLTDRAKPIQIVEKNFSRPNTKKTLGSHSHGRDDAEDHENCSSSTVPEKWSIYSNRLIQKELLSVDQSYVLRSIKEGRWDKLHDQIHTTDTLLNKLNSWNEVPRKLTRHESRLPIIKARPVQPLSSQIEHIDLPICPLSVASNQAQAEGHPLDSRYIPGIGRVRKSNWIRSEGYVGSLDFAKMDESLKRRYPTYPDRVPQNRERQLGSITERSAVRKYEDHSATWDSLDSLGKGMDLKPLPKALRCGLFGARIASHRRLFDGEPKAAPGSILMSN